MTNEPNPQDRGGCGLPGHKTATGYEGTSYCLTCEAEGRAKAKELLATEVQRLVAALAAKDAEYEEYRTISAEEDAIRKGQLAAKDAEIAALKSTIAASLRKSLE
jgi:uncharacterized Zn finger protein (UPF0148 family)